MQIKYLYRYILVKADIPNIVNNVITDDVNVGGVKLKYKVSTVKALVFNIFNKQKIIVFKIIPTTTSIRTFLRPYKLFWDSSRNRLPRCLWGKNNDPLTNLWIELEVDYTDLDKGQVIAKKEIRDTNITKHFSKNKTLFYISKK